MVSVTVLKNFENKSKCNETPAIVKGLQILIDFKKTDLFWEAA